MAAPKKEGAPQNKSTPQGNSNASGPSLTVVGCGVKACMSKVTKMGFCDKHHDEYKFGLLTKTGDKAQDFEKKVIHFEDFKKRKEKSSKAA